MVRVNFPAPGGEEVRDALDLVRTRLPTIGEWLSEVSPTGEPVRFETLNAYREGRREMPEQMRRLLAKRLLEHAAAIQKCARRLSATVRD